MFNQAAQELTTVRDLLRFAVSRFNDAGLFFGHGSDNAHDEAAYLILHTLNLPLDTLEPYLDAKLLQSEKERGIVHSRTPRSGAYSCRISDTSSMAGRV